MPRSIQNITQEEISRINEILQGEYYFKQPLGTPREVEYQCFTKSHAVFSGIGIVNVYEYLKTIDVIVTQ